MTMTVRDEVCGMTIDRTEATSSIEFQGKVYHFCSERCRQRFEEHPDWYVAVRSRGDDGAG